MISKFFTLVCRDFIAVVHLTLPLTHHVLDTLVFLLEGSFSPQDLCTSCFLSQGCWDPRTTLFLSFKSQLICCLPQRGPPWSPNISTPNCSLARHPCHNFVFCFLYSTYYLKLSYSVFIFRLSFSKTHTHKLHESRHGPSCTYTSGTWDIVEYKIAA